MRGQILYVDASALVKDVVTEPETEAFRELLRRWPHRASSAVLAVEVIRAVRRQGTVLEIENAQAAVRAVALVPLDATVVERASSLQPGVLRTLDAIHLATALSLEAQLGALVTYDRRLAEAALAAGIEAVSPR